MSASHHGDDRLAEVLHVALATGVALVLLIPAARGMHAVVGWLPLWLVGMPLMACAAWRVLSPPARPVTRPLSRAIPSRRRTMRAQAVRRPRTAGPATWRHAA